MLFVHSSSVQAHEAFWTTSKIVMVLVLGTSLHLGTMPVAAASAQTCFPGALSATEAALGSSKTFSGLYNEYFGEALAKRALARKEWSKLSSSERQNQLIHTKQKMISYASTIAAYDRSKFSWRGNKVTVTSIINPDDVTNMTVIMSGNDCKIADVCIGKHCLSRMIGDGTKWLPCPTMKCYSIVGFFYTHATHSPLYHFPTEGVALVVDSYRRMA